MQKNVVRCLVVACSSLTAVLWHAGVDAWPILTPAELFVEIASGPMERGEIVHGFIPVGDGVAFFPSVLSLESRPRLWFSDGTSGGTRLLRDGIEIEAAEQSDTVRLPDGRSLIPRVLDQGLGWEPWVTDGTVEGTTLLADLCPGTCGSFVRRVSRAGGRRFFVASVGQGERRIVSLSPDATLEAMGPTDVEDAMPIYDPSAVTSNPIGDVAGLHVVAVIETARFEYAVQLLEWDGTSLTNPTTLLGGLRNVSALEPFRDGALAIYRRVGSSLFELAFVTAEGVEVLASSDELGSVYTAHPATGDEFGLAWALFSVDGGFGEPCTVWRTDGTVAGTWSLGSPPTGGCWGAIEIVAGRAVFSTRDTGSNLRWIVSTDGTTPGFLLLHESEQGLPPIQLMRLGDHAYWLEPEPGTLMRTDGLLPATPVCSFERVTGIFGQAPAVGRAADSLLFSAQGGGGEGLEIWRWDGTSCGAAPVANLWPDERGTNVAKVVALGERAYVHEVERLPDLSAEHAIWQVEGSSGSPVVIAEERVLLGHVGERLILKDPPGSLPLPIRFYGFDPESGSEVELLETYDHRPGFVKDGVFLGGLVPVTAAGRRLDSLWFSDGTLDGTRKLRSFEEAVGVPRFLAWDRGVVFELLQQVWRSDGTEAGTFPLLDAGEFGDTVYLYGVADGVAFMNGSSVSGQQPLRAIEIETGMPRFPEADRVVVPEDGSIQRAVAFRNRLLFFADLPEDGPEGGGQGLWLSDGSKQGTHLVGRFEPTIRSNRIPITVRRGLAFFSAAGTEAGAELFVTDGSPGGTRLLLDAEPGPLGSEPRAPMPVDGVLALERKTSTTGRELWLSDGSNDGTFPVEVEPGPLGSVPAHATAVADRVVFAADRSDVGRELFTLDRRDLRAPCVSSPTAACVGQGRFRVEADWLDRASDTRGRAEAVPFTDDTARFWFFDEGNIELVVKVLDGRAINDDWWVFYGATSDVDYWVTVTDTWSGRSKSYTNRRGDQCGVNDTSAFDREPEIDDLLPETIGSGSAIPQGTTHESEVLSLQGGRFEARVRYFVGEEPGAGLAIPDTEQTGYFWFFDPANVELIVKVLDGRSVNGHWWVYHGGLSDLRYELEITDTETGAVWRDENPARSICGGSDVEAFEDTASAGGTSTRGFGR